MTTNLNGTSVTNPESLYEKDYHLWLNTTAQQLRDRQLHQLDFYNLIEEIESMGASQRRELESRLRVLLMHLLKYKYQPTHRSNSWLCTIDEQRNELDLLFKHSPSLKPYYSEVFTECYIKSRRSAVKETGLPIGDFPEESPFSLEEVLDFDYLPE